MAKYMRVRFHANEDDWRPVKFPPPAPCWCTGIGDGYSIVVAYIPFDDWESTLKTYWPEASEIDATEAEKIVFTDRFPRPDWWRELAEQEAQ